LMFAHLPDVLANLIFAFRWNTMSAGLEWHELDIPYTNAANSKNRVDASPDPYRFVLDQPVVAPPGDVWEYNSEATEPVVKKAVGKQVDDFARAVSAVLS